MLYQGLLLLLQMLVYLVGMSYFVYFKYECKSFQNIYEPPVWKICIKLQNMDKKITFVAKKQGCRTMWLIYPYKKVVFITRRYATLDIGWYYHNNKNHCRHNLPKNNNKQIKSSQTYRVLKNSAKCCYIKDCYCYFRY